jgi:phospholipid/cholesterol/gamma-HCH transport system substrate-binding protein
MRRRSKRQVTNFQAGVIAIVVIGVLTYFGFTKANPFAHPYKLNAAFQTANNLKPNSPVRIAGVDVGKVKKVEPLEGDTSGARVEMEIKDKGLPIHRDATMKVRQRVFLEGNFFIDLKPGSPSAPTVDSGHTIPMNQTAAPVQFGELLAALQSDTRDNLKTFLDEYSKGLEGSGARGFNEAIRYWEEAYRNSALANDATLGVEPTKDIPRVLKGQQRTFAALDANPEALKDLITNFNTFAGSLAREDVALSASIPALRDTLRVANPALRQLDNALPTVRAFAREALPGVRSSAPTLDASIPFITQARKLVARSELRGAAAELRRWIPSFVRLNEVSVGLADEGRQLSACTNNALVPFLESTVPDPDLPLNSNQKVREQIQRGFPGLAGESRLSDGNTQFFHAASVQAGPKVRPAPPPDGGDQPPPHRPDIPCETQEPPNLNAPGGPIAAITGKSSGPRPNVARAFRRLEANLAKEKANARRKGAKR